MTRQILCLIVLLCFTSALTKGVDPKIVKADDQEEVCFDSKSAQLLLDMRLRLPLMTDENSLLKQKVDIKDQQLAKMKEGVTDLASQIDILTASNADLQKHVNVASAWYYSPYFWLAIGLVAGFGATYGVMRAVRP